MLRFSRPRYACQFPGQLRSGTLAGEPLVTSRRPTLSLALDRVVQPQFHEAGPRWSRTGASKAPRAAIGSGAPRPTRPRMPLSVWRSSRAIRVCGRLPSSFASGSAPCSASRLNWRKPPRRRSNGVRRDCPQPCKSRREIRASKNAASAFGEAFGDRGRRGGARADYGALATEG